MKFVDVHWSGQNIFFTLVRGDRKSTKYVNVQQRDSEAEHAYQAVKSMARQIRLAYEEIGKDGWWRAARYNLLGELVDEVEKIGGLRWLSPSK